MICLDTNYLIMALVAASREAERLVDWAESGKRLYVPAVVWYEFLWSRRRTTRVNDTDGPSRHLALR